MSGAPSESAGLTRLRECGKIVIVNERLLIYDFASLSRRAKGEENKMLLSFDLNAVWEGSFMGLPVGGPAEGSGWSLLSLIFALIGLAISVKLIVSGILRRRHRVAKENARGDDEEANAGYFIVISHDKHAEDSASLAMPALIFGLLSFALFFSSNNISLPVVWLNRGTVLVAMVFVFHLVFLLASVIEDRISKADERQKCEWKWY
jgi:hypothetical protein